ncbi:MAG: hypothetical protein K8T26_02175 [Lentisphaerae bacterium]|nr:hypothetical protein [Lentisphaerota bacterium]
MNRLLLIAPVLLLAAGCIRVEQKLVLRPDASGTFEVKYEVPEETTQRIKAMLKLADELTAAGGSEVQPLAEDDFTRLVFDPEEAALRKRIESYARYGIRLDEFELLARNARRQVKFTVSFSNIAEVAKADFFPSYGFSIAKNKVGQYVLFTRPVTREPLDATWADAGPDAYKLMAPLLNGFHFQLQVQAPGRVLETNADQKEPYSAQWTYAFDTNPRALADLQRAQMTIVFDSTGLVYPEFRQPTPTPTPAMPVRTLAAPASAPPANAATNVP